MRLTKFRGSSAALDTKKDNGSPSEVSEVVPREWEPTPVPAQSIILSRLKVIMVEEPSIDIGELD